MKPSVPVLLVLTLSFTSGCSLFHYKSKKASPPELPPAAGVEAEFRDRWMNKRVHELLSSGAAKTEDEAAAMATTEFAKTYPLLNSANRGSGR